MPFAGGYNNRIIGHFVYNPVFFINASAPPTVKITFQQFGFSDAGIVIPLNILY